VTAEEAIARRSATLYDAIVLLHDVIEYLAIHERLARCCSPA